MDNSTESFIRKVNLLKEARLQLLQLHKMLVDLERSRYEHIHGGITSGKFLNLLISDEDFAWLRKFSALIVEIDEMFNLDDGYHEGFVDGHLEAIRQIVSLETGDEDFNHRFSATLEQNPKVAGKKSDLEGLLKQ